MVLRPQSISPPAICNSYLPTIFSNFLILCSISSFAIYSISPWLCSLFPPSICSIFFGLAVSFSALQHLFRPCSIFLRLFFEFLGSFAVFFPLLFSVFLSSCAIFLFLLFSVFLSGLPSEQSNLSHNWAIHCTYNMNGYNPKDLLPLLNGQKIIFFSLHSYLYPIWLILLWRL